MDSPTLLQLVVAAVMMFAGATVISTVGFGIGMTVTPVLLLVLDPQSVVVLINTLSLILFVLILYQTRRHIMVREALPIALAGLAGVPIGVFILSTADEGVLRIGISGLIIALTVLVIVNVRLAMFGSRWVGVLVGFVVGLLLTSLAIGGPLMVLYMLARNTPRQAMRATLALTFLVIESSSVVGYGVAGLYTAERVVLILVAAVPVLLGFAFATVLLKRMNERVFQHAVVVVIIVTSLMVLGRELLRL